MAVKKSKLLIPLFPLFMALLMSGLCAGIAMAGGTTEASPRFEKRLSAKPVAAENFDLSKVDFSEAIVSIARPRHLYIRDATYDSQDVSFILESANIAERVWKVKEIFTEDLSHIPDNIYLDFAEITPVSPEDIKFREFIIDGVAYTAKMRIVNPKTLKSLGYQEDEFSQRYNTTVAQVQKPTTAVDVEACKAQIKRITEETDAFTDIIAKLESEYNELNSLQEALEQLVKSMALAPPPLALQRNICR